MKGGGGRRGLSLSGLKFISVLMTMVDAIVRRQKACNTLFKGSPCSVHTQPVSRGMDSILLWIHLIMYSNRQLFTTASSLGLLLTVEPVMNCPLGMIGWFIGILSQVNHKGLHCG